MIKRIKEIIKVGTFSNFQFGVSSIPSIFLIDPEGKFVRGEKLILKGEYLSETLKEYIEP